MLSLRNISKVYHVGAFGGRELRAVSDVSFDIQDGQVVSLIGESGSGKSTIGRMILRLVPSSSGALIVDGLDVSGLRGSQLRDYYRKVQGVFQDPFSSYNPIFKADRVFATLRQEFFPQAPEAEWSEKVAASLKAVGLNPEQVLGKFPHQLSGGQLQRLLIARALLLDIKVLVADEIISMLDASTRIDVLNLLADLKTRGLSILFITHDLSLGYYISDRSIILYRGKVVEMGPTAQIYDDPRHPYTRMLMDAVPRLDRRWRGKEAGLPAGPAAPAEGCPYYGRCPLASRDCLQEPGAIEVEKDHLVACWKGSAAQPSTGGLST
jgi:peptide/nickel transport system ATP-binding protein